MVSLQIAHPVSPTRWGLTAIGVIASSSLGIVTWFVFPMISITVGMFALAIVVAAGASGGREQRARRRAHRRREAARQRQLQQVGAIRVQQYEELRELVASCDQPAIDRYDLEGLLDQFAQLAQAHWRHTQAVKLASCDEKLAGARPSLSQQIRHRRVEDRGVCVRETELLADDLDTTEELVRFVVQRVLAPPPRPRIEHEVDRRLADLDEVDHAHEDLARSFG
jgi:hypothetical protein